MPKSIQGFKVRFETEVDGGSMSLEAKCHFYCVSCHPQDLPWLFQKKLAVFWVGRRVHSKRQAPPAAPGTRALKTEFVGSELTLRQGGELGLASPPCPLQRGLGHLGS